MQIQHAHGREQINKIWDLLDMVPAQVHFLHMTHLLKALWNRGELLHTQVQAASFIKRQLDAVQSHFQRDSFAFPLLPLG